VQLENRLSNIHESFIVSGFETSAAPSVHVSGTNSVLQSMVVIDQELTDPFPSQMVPNSDVVQFVLEFPPM